jgi:hypothetical protein
MLGGQIILPPQLGVREGKQDLVTGGYGALLRLKL